MIATIPFRNHPGRGIFVLAILLTALATSCGGGSSSSPEDSTSKPTDSGLSGTIQIDGSSTVYPITQAVSEEFGNQNSGVQVTVAVSGTGGGFRRFVAGDTDISDASRPITADEIEQAAANGVEYIEITIAFDGIAIAVNKNHDVVECVTIEELAAFWSPGGVNQWNEVRTGLPAQKVNLYGPGTDSGTFDYFTEAVNGAPRRSRADYTASEDDNVLVQGISGDPNSLGYFGFAYYSQNTDRLSVLGVDNGDGCLLPTHQTIKDNTYPLSRPLFIYVNRRSLNKPEVRAFVDFYLQDGPALVEEVGYVALPDSMYADGMALLPQ